MLGMVTSSSVGSVADVVGSVGGTQGSSSYLRAGMVSFDSAMRLVWRLVTADRGEVSSCILLVLCLFDSNSIRCVVGRSGKVSLASVVRV